MDKVATIVGSLGLASIYEKLGSFDILVTIPDYFWQLSFCFFSLAYSRGLRSFFI